MRSAGVSKCLINLIGIAALIAQKNSGQHGGNTITPIKLCLQWICLLYRTRADGGANLRLNDCAFINKFDIH